MTIAAETITADAIAATYPTDCGLEVVEFHNGAMCIADTDDLAEFGEAFRATNTIKFAADVAHADRIAAMIFKLAA